MSTMYLIASMFRLFAPIFRRFAPPLNGVEATPAGNIKSGAAEFGGEFGGTAVGRGHRVRDDSTKAGAVKDLESRCGGTALRGDLLAQSCQGVGGLARHLRGSECRFQRQSMRDVTRQAALMGRRFERLHK